MSASQTALSRDSQASCLAASAALDMAAGRLAPDEHARAKQHVARCAACEFVVATAREQHALALLEAGSNGRVGMLLAQRYRLLRLAGRGGMGDVFEAHDELLDARIALKCLAPRWAESGSAQARLKREVLLARRVSHPNVARVFDFGSHAQADGTCLSFLTMEFVEGGSLRQRVAGRAQPRQQVLCIVRQLLRALAEAHRVGVLHRDLKSDNILLRDLPLSEGPSVVVTDFGLARALTPERTHVSASQLFLGTPGYLAPEQIQGGRLTVRTDLYSLGVVCFELLTGSLPFLADTALATAMQRLQQPAPRISERVPSVPRVWDEFVARCLEREPARRFASAEEAHAALAPLSEHGAVQARRARSGAGVRGLALGLVLGASLENLPESSLQHAARADLRASLSPQVESPPPSSALCSVPFELLARSPLQANSAAAPALKRQAPRAITSATTEPSTQAALPPAAIATRHDATESPPHDFIDPFAATSE